MKLLGEAAIGFLDVVLGSLPRHPEHGIRVSHWKGPITHIADAILTAS